MEHYDFSKHIEKFMSMTRLTKDHLVNIYWQNVEELERNQLLPFFVEGSLAWETNKKNRISSPNQKVWLESRYYDPDGKPFDAESLAQYLQNQMNLYEIVGCLKIEINKDDVSSAKTKIDESISSISLLTDLISFSIGASLSWRPASYVEVNVIKIPSSSRNEETGEFKEWRFLPLSRDQGENLSFRVKDDFFEKILANFEEINNLQNKALSALLRRAFAWHAQGNFLGSGINRFINYWESLELVCHFLYEHLPEKIIGRVSRVQRKSKVLEIMKTNITESNCLKIANQLTEVVKSSIKTEVLSVLNYLTDDTGMDKLLFGINNPKNKSLYQIRNDIAHGNFAYHELEFRQLVDNHLYDMQDCSKKVIINTLKKMPELLKIIDSE